MLKTNMATTTISIETFIVAAILVGLTGFLLRSKKSHPLPPGPTTWPIVGNITDLPPSSGPDWEFWARHKDLYGPISSITVLGTTIVILNSAQLTLELLEKRSNIYSSRPQLTFVGEMVGWENSTVLLQYNDRWRASRKAMHSIIGSKAALSRMYPLQDAEVHRFLLRVLEEPERFEEHLRTEAGAIILKTGYGYAVDWHERDPLVELAERVTEEFSAAAVPGTWIVDTIPFLRHLPEWMPGAGFQKTAKQYRARVLDFVNKPRNFVKKQMAKGNYDPSYLSTLYEKAGDEMDAEQDFVLKWSAASLYAGGSDTSVSTLNTFFLAMLVHPEVQRKAQEEIDRVVGSDRLPNFDDRENLPYVDAIAREAFRWHPVAPMGIPHLTSADNIYGGYLIPKGAVVLQNIWWFTHDPAVYHDPSSFNPSRHLGPDPCPDPRNYVFGFGRRACPGKLLADSSVWLTIARSLAVFDITKGRDENGKEIEPEVRFKPGAVSYPVPFKATVRPRSSAHEALIRQAETLHPWEKGCADEL
ncbi:cytochrome P450 oxidoreductase OrdA-like protein [Xylariaceae sp. FL0662B]|nr:cytochrome P450 oxidoreductase OrdA-like protein [Xylariaceae sp. FL0662B]